MQRSWPVEADQLAKIEDGTTIPVISQQALAKALCDLAILIDRAGGHGSIATIRRRTMMDNVSVTVQALVQWRDRADAKPQPERIEPAAVAAANGHSAEPSAALIAEPEPEYVQPSIETIALAEQHAADLRGELDEHEQEEPVVPAAENDAVQTGGQPLPQLQRLAEQREQARASNSSGARIITGEEAAAQHRYDASVQGHGQDEVEVDEQDVPPRLRG